MNNFRKGQSNVVLAILGAAAMLSLAIVAAAILYTKKDAPIALRDPGNASTDGLEAKVLPTSTTLPVEWSDLGARMVEAGVVDSEAFKGIYAERGGLSKDMVALLERPDNGKIVMTKDNAGVLLNLFWALGLGNKNDILESGEMADPRYGSAAGFASTGGWSLAKGSPMAHYSAHQFIVLDAQAQAKVERVSKNIFRPCCGNSTHFPDCNHGMAMLGLLELMASQGASEEAMYRTALQVNAYWFPEQYLTIASFMASQGISWDAVDPKKMLSAEYSSGAGYRNIAAAVEASRNPSETPQPRSSGGCSV